MGAVDVSCGRWAVDWRQLENLFQPVYLAALGFLDIDRIRTWASLAGQSQLDSGDVYDNNEDLSACFGLSPS